MHRMNHIKGRLQEDPRVFRFGIAVQEFDDLNECPQMQCLVGMKICTFSQFWGQSIGRICMQLQDVKIKQIRNPSLLNLSSAIEAVPLQYCIANWNCHTS